MVEKGQQERMHEVVGLGQKGWTMNLLEQEAAALYVEELEGLRAVEELTVRELRVVHDQVAWEV